LVVIAHITVGTLILVATIINFIQSVRLKNRHMIKFKTAGLTGVLLAVIGGETFITTQNDLAS
jgi:hypothetical protein